MPKNYASFVNYAYVIKKCRDFASTFYLEFGENTSLTMKKQKQVNDEHIPHSRNFKNA